MPVVLGSIPALAGKPAYPSWLRKVNEVYPRARGEADERTLSVHGQPGLSPRSRGSRVSTWYRSTMAGSIPALAGKPSILANTSHPSRVYPRARGEARASPGKEFCLLGLSPRSRGSRRYGFRLPCPLGSIPALAGKPSPLLGAHCGQRVYPRARGEAGMGILPRQRHAGLSPRSRGSPLDTLQFMSARRSIPALAGKPLRPGFRAYPPTVYPRARGEAEERIVMANAATGLSPRSRGSRAFDQGDDGRVGSIPALAGKPDHPRRRRYRQRVYPRARGEAGIVPGARVGDVGLSPRSRGSPHGTACGHPLHRSIPALAGKPFVPHYSANVKEVYPRARGEAGTV